MINTKRIQTSHALRATGSAKIAKAMIPEVSPVQIKVITDKPAKVVAHVRAVSPVKTVAPKAVPAVKAVAPKAVVPIKIAAPVKIVPQAKAVEPPKPVISAKHIMKPKRVIPKKPVAAFTISFARPVAGHNIVTSNRVASPNFIRHPRPVVVAPVVQPKPVAQPIPRVASAIPVAPPKPPVQIKPVIAAIPVPTPKPLVQPNPVVVTIQVPPPKPVVQPKPEAPAKPITPKIIILAPVYPPHEIIKSNISLKQDITANPHDYETQAFDFDLKCANGHFWAAGKALPVSNGIAFCLQCGERLRKPKSKKHRSTAASAFFLPSRVSLHTAGVLC